MGWFEQRHIERPNASKLTCISCNGFFWLPKSKETTYLTCSSDCDINRRKKIKDERTKNCEFCGNSFVPRTGQLKVGKGKYCSLSCSTKYDLKFNRTKESWERASLSRKQSFLEGKWEPLSGEKSPRWTGGKKKSDERIKERTRLGINAERVRAYRKKYPNKVKEFAHTRKGRKFGRLPNGTVKKIGDNQKWKCIVCKCNIKDKYHMDHIQPLAKGGLHTPDNIQLLCPSCNVRKSAKDPLQFMQENNYLL